MARAEQSGAVAWWVAEARTSLNISRTSSLAWAVLRARAAWRAAVAHAARRTRASQRAHAAPCRRPRPRTSPGLSLLHHLHVAVAVAGSAVPPTAARRSWRAAR
uniref:Uncharacterized protein n=1 Tax=Arundo donax TaxID=35708 RepID=A0A0A9BS91_ARUDO